jgi:hypothetical protein
MQVLEHVAQRAVQWSVAADRLKSRQERARAGALALSIVGSLLAAVASQVPAEGAAGSAAAYPLLHKALALGGAAMLAAAAFVAQRFLGADKTTAWTLARATSEALKREAFLFATQAGAYATLQGEPAEQRLLQEMQAAEAAAVRVAAPVPDPGRAGSAPRTLLTHVQYRVNRVRQQADGYYRVKAQLHAARATRWRRWEFGLALGASLCAVVAGSVGKLPLGAIAFDSAALSALLASMAAAIVAHLEATRLDELARTYGAAARQLDDIDLGFDRARQLPLTWSAYVEACEAVIANENASWVARWAEVKAA